MYIIFWLFGKFITKAVVYFPFFGKVHIKELPEMSSVGLQQLKTSGTEFGQVEGVMQVTSLDPIPVSYGGGAQSNFPTCDHQNIFYLIHIWIFYIFFNILGGGGGDAPWPLWAIWLWW